MCSQGTNGFVKKGHRARTDELRRFLVGFLGLWGDTDGKQQLLCLCHCTAKFLRDRAMLYWLLEVCCMNEVLVWGGWLVRLAASTCYLKAVATRASTGTSRQASDSQGYLGYLEETWFFGCFLFFVFFSVSSEIQSSQYEVLIEYFG